MTYTNPKGYSRKVAGTNATSPSHSTHVKHDQNKVMQNPKFGRQGIKGVEYTGRK